MLDPNNKMENLILNILHNGISVHVGCIGIEKVISGLQSGFSEAGYVCTENNNMITVREKESDLTKKPKTAGLIDINNDGIYFHWARDCEAPIYFIGLTLKIFMEKFGDINNIFETLKEEDVFVMPSPNSDSFS